MGCAVHGGRDLFYVSHTMIVLHNSYLKLKQRKASKAGQVCFL